MKPEDRRAPALLVMVVTIAPEHQPEFHAWYDHEHVPELLRIPGFRSATRYDVCSEPDTFMAVYELDRVDVVESAAFLEWRRASRSTDRMAALFSRSLRFVGAPRSPA